MGSIGGDCIPCGEGMDSISEMFNAPEPPQPPPETVAAVTSFVFHAQGCCDWKTGILEKVNWDSLAFFMAFCFSGRQTVVRTVEWGL